jgi:hypothetical protein
MTKNTQKIDLSQYKRVSEVTGEKRLDVKEVVKIDGILGYDVIIHDVKICQGDFGEYAFFSVSLDNPDGKVGVVCGGKVVVKKAKVLVEKGQFPVIGKFVKVGGGKNKYYDLV